MQEGQQRQSGARPYRSHLRPACVPCRRRKSRCQTAGDAAVCLTCRAHQTECFFPGDSRESTSPGSARRRRRVETRPSSLEPSGANPLRVAQAAASFRDSAKDNTSASVAGPVPDVPPRPIAGMSRTGQNYHDHEEESTLALGSDDDQHLNLHIVGPAATNEVLSTYLSGIPGATRSTRLIIPEPASCSRPVLFTEVQKRPFGVKLNRSPSAEKLEIIEKLLEPHNEAVIDELVISSLRISASPT